MNKLASGRSENFDVSADYQLNNFNRIKGEHVAEKPLDDCKAKTLGKNHLPPMPPLVLKTSLHHRLPRAVRYPLLQTYLGGNTSSLATPREHYSSFHCLTYHDHHLLHQPEYSMKQAQKEPLSTRDQFVFGSIKKNNTDDARNLYDNTWYHDGSRIIGCEDFWRKTILVRQGQAHEQLGSLSGLETSKCAGVKDVRRTEESTAAAAASTGTGRRGRGRPRKHRYKVKRELKSE